MDKIIADINCFWDKQLIIVKKIDDERLRGLRGGQLLLKQQIDRLSRVEAEARTTLYDGDAVFDCHSSMIQDDVQQKVRPSHVSCGHERFVAVPSLEHKLTFRDDSQTSNLMQKCFHAWQNVVVKSRQKSAQIGKLLSAHGRQLITTAFLAWKDKYSAIERYSQIHKIIEQDHRYNVLYKSYHRWKSQNTIRDFILQGENSRSCSRLQKMLVLWRQFTKLRIAVRKCLQINKARSRQKVLQACSEAAVISFDQKIAAKRALTVFTRGYWRIWEEQLDTRRKDRQKIQVHERRRNKNILDATFCAWVILNHQNLERKALVSKWGLCYLRQAMKRWRIMLQCRCQTRRAVLRICSYMKKQLLATSFRRLKRIAAREIQLNHVLHRIFDRRHLQYSYDLWVSVMMQDKRRGLNLIRMRVIARVTTWHLSTARKRRLRQMSDEISELCKLSKLRKYAWVPWKDAVHTRCEFQRAMLHHNNILGRKVLWVLSYQAQKHFMLENSRRIFLQRTQTKLRHCGIRRWKMSWMDRRLYFKRKKISEEHHADVLLVRGFHSLEIMMRLQQKVRKHRKQLVSDKLRIHLRQWRVSIRLKKEMLKSHHDLVRQKVTQNEYKEIFRRWRSAAHDKQKYRMLVAYRSWMQYKNKNTALREAKMLLRRIKVHQIVQSWKKSTDKSIKLAAISRKVSRTSKLRLKRCILFEIWARLVRRRQDASRKLSRVCCVFRLQLFFSIWTEHKGLSIACRNHKNRKMVKTRCRHFSSWYNATVYCSKLTQAHWRYKQLSVSIQTWHKELQTSTLFKKALADMLCFQLTRKIQCWYGSVKQEVRLQKLRIEVQRLERFGLLRESYGVWKSNIEYRKFIRRRELDVEAQRAQKTMRLWQYGLSMRKQIEQFQCYRKIHLLSQVFQLWCNILRKRRVAISMLQFVYSYHKLGNGFKRWCAYKLFLDRRLALVMKKADQKRSYFLRCSFHRWKWWRGRDLNLSTCSRSIERQILAKYHHIWTQEFFLIRLSKYRHRRKLRVCFVDGLRSYAFLRQAARYLGTKHEVMITKFVFGEWKKYCQSRLEKSWALLQSQAHFMQSHVIHSWKRFLQQRKSESIKCRDLNILVDYPKSYSLAFRHAKRVQKHMIWRQLCTLYPSFVAWKRCIYGEPVRYVRDAT